MSEIPGASVTSFQLQQALQRDKAPFVNAVGRSLDVAYAEQRQLTDVNPVVWLGWAMGNLSGDERVNMVGATDPAITSLSPRVQGLLGGTIAKDGKQYLDYRTGELGQRLQALHARNNPGAQRRIESVSKSAARFVHTLGHVIGFDSPNWRDYVPMAPQTQLVPSEQGLDVRFSTPGVPKYPVGGPAETVVAYGPGMTGMLVAAQTFGRTKEMHFVSGGLGAMFVNEYTEHAHNAAIVGMEDMRRSGKLARQLPPYIRAADVFVPGTHYYADGIADSVPRIAAKTTERGQPVDVVLMSSVHSAGAEEGIAGVEGAHRLLREGGLLVVKAPETSVGNEGGMDVVGPVAARLFGAPAVAGECGILGQYADPSLPSERPAAYAIYRNSYTSYSFRPPPGTTLG